MVKLIWTELAVEYLKTIHEFIAQDSGVYADRLIEKIISRVDQVSNYPLSGRIVPEFNKEFLRELIEGNYRIIYLVNSDFIAVTRMHHAARQLTL